ncbi:unnamed protein product [Rhodiola kirilowii]
MAVQHSPPPLYEVIHLKSKVKHFIEVFLLLLLLSLLAYRILSLYGDYPMVFLLAFVCEASFTLVWVMVISTKWTPLEHKTYPDRLLQQFHDLPPVDIFVTTADPKLEPPTITVNTVLSFLAADYEPHKLACYVSDDSGSPITLYALIQASEFAKHWVPFCKKYEIQVRAPFRFFGTPQESLDAESLVFQKEWQDMKDKYDQLIFKVEEACESETELLESNEFDIFANMKRDNHDSLVKVIHANEGVSDGVPHLIYVAREKKPGHPNHYKAGALNVLTRVSGVMTNAPFMLNLDCDMYNNNPKTFHHAMCLFLGSQSQECAFVQFPQVFYNGLKDDPFGNQLVVLHKYVSIGINGIQGSFYTGTGCFHQRKVFYGKSLSLDQEYGKSPELINSIDNIGSKSSIMDSLKATYKVASCDYEYGTNWGVNIGWLYGSVAEDSLTGITIHSKGYKSMYCDPEPPSFMGCAPPSGPLTSIQIKRWTTGLLEIFFSLKNPVLLSLTSNLQLRQSVAYTWIFVWGLRSIPELCYSLLPAYCIFSNTAFLPKIDQSAWAWLLPFMIFVVYNLYMLAEYLQCNLSVRSWWNNQRASRINSCTGCLFGVIGLILKFLGLSETVFEVTNKGESDIDDGRQVEKDAGRFTFNDSPIFVPATTLVLVNLAAVGSGFVSIIWSVLNANRSDMRKIEYGASELGSCVWLLLMFSPFVKGLFGKGKYGIPMLTILKSMAFTLAFLSFCLKA